MRPLGFAGLLVLCSGLACAGPFARRKPARDVSVLEDRVARAAASAKGTVGLAVEHVESGRAVYVRADDTFPMMSVYKLPIAVALLWAESEGRVQSDEVVTITDRDVSPPSFLPIAKAWTGQPITRRVGDLMKLMVVDSDNTATDKLLEVLGGGPAVTAALGARGLEHIRVDRKERAIAAAWCGVPADQEPTIRYGALLAACDASGSRGGGFAEPSTEVRDTATPAGMMRLLVRLQKGELLDPERTARLFTLLRASVNGHLIKRLLPPDTVVAHKSGRAVKGVVGDAGLITLPNGRGHVAVSVFIKDTSVPPDEAAAVIGEISKAAYDFFAADR